MNSGAYKICPKFLFSVLVVYSYFETIFFFFFQKELEMFVKMRNVYAYLFFFKQVQGNS